MPNVEEFGFDPEFATQFGLVSVGGALEPARVLRAYAAGIFPWFNEGDPVCWWSPDPRAIFELDRFHVPRRLARTIRSGKFRVTVNEDFAGVIRGCADRDEGTWITREMMHCYETLHRQGHVHSVETWLGDELVGGIYGVAIGGFFGGESMFCRVTDASKVALVALIERLKERSFALFDSQILNDHTGSLGAIEISREEYLERLKKAQRLPVTFAENK
ncbi:MAG: leucyl/phenylalanyl-tRNA--protein transferase [Gemmataceae bacterium]|nr:leucyl/phenylalanyl-tRNA--protein transferase [Gemmataceae bacterium]